MPATPVAIADAVVTVLNGTFAAALTAERGYVLPTQLEKATTLKAWVMAAEIDGEAADRGSDTETHTIHIALVKQVANFLPATVDPLILQAEHVRDHFKNLELPGVDAVVTKRDAKPLYDPQRLRLKRLFLSLISLEITVNREVA